MIWNSIQLKNGNAEKVNKFSSKIYNNCDEKKVRWIKQNRELFYLVKEIYLFKTVVFEILNS